MKRIQNAPGIPASIRTLRRFAESFDGLTFKEAKKRLSRGKAKMEMDTWSLGKTLIASFPMHQVRLMFVKGKVLMTMVTVFAE